MDTKQIIGEERKKRLWVIGVTAAVCMLVAIMIVALSTCSSRTTGKGESLAVSGAIDSMEQKLPSGTGFVAKFPDKRRHCMFYLNGGHLYKFDGVTKRLDEVTFGSLTEETAIYYNDNDINAGINEAVLSPDNEFIILTATVMPTGQDGKAMQGLYRMNTVNLTIEALAQGYVTREGDLFFVSVIDKTTGKRRALLGFDKSGKQLSREKQQEAIRANKYVAAEEEGDGTTGESEHDETEPTPNNTPAATHEVPAVETNSEQPSTAPASP